MAKKVLKVTDFKGGVNSFADARDIADNEFAQNWNAALDKAGIVRFTGGGAKSVINLPHDNTNFEPGYGLFSTGIDNQISVIDGEFENGFEEGTVASYADSHSGSPFSGNPVIGLAATSSHVSATNHATDNYYNNYCIVITSGNGQGQTRRIVDYDGTSKKAQIDSVLGTDADTSSTYKIFRWVGDGSTFGNSGGTDYIDKGNTTTADWNDDIESYNTNNSSSYFLRTKVASVADNQSENLGFITYNPNNAASDFTEDSTDIGATTLLSGTTYTLSFYCKAATRYYGYIANGASYGERVPFVQLY